MKKSILFFGLATAILTSSCEQFKKGDGGLQYNIVKDAGNAKVGTGDVLSFHAMIINDKDSIVNNTYEVGLPNVIQIPDNNDPQAYAGDYYSMFRMLGEGDSAVFRLDVDTLVARTGQPKPDFADKFIEFRIKVDKVFQKGDLSDSLLNDNVRAYYDGLINDLKDSENARIDKYISKNNLKTQKTESGLQYVVEKEGDGVKLTPGDSVVVNYTGAVIGGIVFDTSVEEVAKKEKLYNALRTYEPATFPIGTNMMLPGWDEGIQLMSKGAKYKLIIPSALGYGEFGQQFAKIAPYSPLVFDVEILDVKKGTAPVASEEPAQ
jgi:FKBP-type peptidyl-prolyl cis-trans isomerase FkpA